MDVRFRTFFSLPILMRFGLHLGHFWITFWGSISPFWSPKLPQVESKTAFEAHVLSKMRFCKNSRKTKGFSTFLAFQIAPKTPQDRSKALLVVSWAPLRASWLRLLVSRVSLLQWGLENGPFLPPNPPHEFSTFLTLLKKRNVGNQKFAPRCLKRLPRGSKEDPRGPQEEPRGSNRVPRWL